MLAAAGVASAVVSGTPALAASPPKPATMKISVPSPVHVNKTYRVTVSGHTTKPLFLALFVQTESQGKCRKTMDGESSHGAYSVFEFPGPLVGPGDYKVKSSKLVDTKANGHDYACAYLWERTHDAQGYHVVLRKQKRYKSKP